MRSRPHVRRSGRLLAEDVRLRDLRYMVGTHAGQSGANVLLVRDLLCHKNLAVIGRHVSRAADPVRT